MINNMDIVGKLWGFCNKLRHDGVDSSDYIEQLTYLLFLKMANEKGISVPKGYDWQSLLTKDNGALVFHLESILHKLKNESGILGQIFAEPVSRVKNGDVLKGLIKEIDEIHWTSIDADVVGLAFEELIGRVANDGKKGAGQYFTPRPLIQTIVNVIRPNPFEEEKSNFKISDVACGTAGFLVVACEWIKKNREKEYKIYGNLKKFQKKIFYGQELVQRPRRLALMNLFLHGIDASETIALGDSIEGEQNEDKFDIIITNPPFGNKGAAPTIRDFPVKTSDKQLNFVQHIIEKLKEGGRAAVVLPDSCLSSDKAKEIWEYYLDKESNINLHTILKLPNGTFAAYANGIKACVIFLQKGLPTKNIWIYDARTNVINVTKKSRPLNTDFFNDFEKEYLLDPNGHAKRKETERFKKFTLKQIKENGFNMDFKWLRDNILDSDLHDLNDPNEIIEHIFQLLDGIKKDLEPSLELFKKKRPHDLLNWENHKLSEVLISLESGSRPKGGVGTLSTGIPSIGGEHLDNTGSFNFSNIKYVSEQFVDLMTNGKIEQNDILIVKDGATTGKVSFVDNNFPFPRAVINEHVFICRISKLLNSKYFFWYLWSEVGQNKIRESFAGVIGGIRQSFAEELDIPIAPIKEQNQIVNTLNLIFEKINIIIKKINKIPKALEVYRSLVLERAIAGTLFEKWHKEENENLINSKENLGLKIPETWSFIKLKNLVEKPEYGSSRKSSDTGKIPVLRMGNIQEGTIDWNHLKYSSNEEEIQKYLLNKDDILFNRTNSPELVGKTAIYKEGKPAIFAGYLIRLRCKKDLNPDYLNICLNSPYAKRYYEIVKVDSNNQSNINATKLIDFLIPYPSSISEQTRIVVLVEKFLKKANEAEQKYNDASQLIFRLQKTVLNMAFRGELSELQLNEKPVSSLLETIRKEKEQIDKKKKELRIIMMKNKKQTKISDQEFDDQLQEKLKITFGNNVFTSKEMEKCFYTIAENMEYDDFTDKLTQFLREPLSKEDSEPFLIQIFDKKQKSLLLRIR